MKREKRKLYGRVILIPLIFMALLLGAFWGTCMTVHATGNESGQETASDEVQALDEVDYDAVETETENKLFSEFDFAEIDDSLKKIFPEKKLSFQELVSSLIQGDGENAGKEIIQFISDRFFYEFKHNRQNLVYMLLIAIIAAVFTNFSNAFQNKQVSEISFYVLYMLLITMCLNAFRIAMEGIEGQLEVLLDFMRVLCPSYFLAVAIASGSSSSLIFYNIVLFLIYVAEALILRFLLPIVNIYIMVQVMNYLAEEEYLSQFAELLKKLVSWILKTLVTLVIGINIIQGMLAPAIDALRRSALTRTAQAIPGIGNAIGGVADVVLGTAVLIKNGIGMAGAVILISICAVPILQVVFMMLMYKLAAALVQPVSDKRITNCISSVSEGYELLVKVVFSTGVLFLLTIAVVTATTT
ncbi:stage III sporulation protein AE [Faecalicatena contorta]|uniref:Stage III sporulation protein AE n=1 Tax=Faecalicatena contorta TaxID=39482 RepID=A0A316A5I1_9FIRM|nr:stage III sporulation protein AE [Faecalicatena contorta]PWJ52210.1 stage III sporulation protein AE [Faecalicatena contorta]SUQ12488.1 stage III sporulation protein AE [Faecalicatena contorta]